MIVLAALCVVLSAPSERVNASRLRVEQVTSTAPVQLIIDTDLGFDVDDVGALAVAHALADQGHVDTWRGLQHRP